MTLIETPLSDWPVGLANGWHPIAYAEQVKAKPVAVRLLGRSLVLFRTGTGIGVLEDRCPHRNVPLSRGSLKDGVLACPYHGWEFGADGTCQRAPGSAICPKAAARAYPAVVRAGLVWTSLSDKPAPFPTLPAAMEDTALDGFLWHLPVSKGRILDAIENLLDPMHPYYLHPGLVRSGARRAAMQVTLTTDDGGCEARYVEDRTSMPWLAGLLERDRAASYGRYWAPNFVQIAFEDSKGLTLAISVVFAPQDEHHTRPFAHFATRKAWLPAWLKRTMLIAFHTPVIAQDRVALAYQSDTIAAFEGPAFHTGPLDFFGPTIWALVNGKSQPHGTQEFDIIP